VKVLWNCSGPPKKGDSATSISGKFASTAPISKYFCSNVIDEKNCLKRLNNPVNSQLNYSHHVLVSILHEKFLNTANCSLAFIFCNVEALFTTDFNENGTFFLLFTKDLKVFECFSSELCGRIVELLSLRYVSNRYFAAQLDCIIARTDHITTY
jgi:hypothetical protein